MIAIYLTLPMSVIIIDSGYVLYFYSSHSEPCVVNKKINACVYKFAILSVEMPHEMLPLNWFLLRSHVCTHLGVTYL